jgi:hypothetical protein
MNNTTDNNAYGVPLHRFVRISICGMPALLWGALFAIFDPTFGGLCAIAGFWLGWQCTEARPERGESDNPNAIAQAPKPAPQNL